MPILRRRELEKKIRSLRSNLPPIKIRGVGLGRPSREASFEPRPRGERDSIQVLRDHERHLREEGPQGEARDPLPAIKGSLFHEAISRAITDSKRLLFSEGIIPGYSIVEELLPKLNEAITSILEEMRAQEAPVPDGG